MGAIALRSKPIWILLALLFAGYMASNFKFIVDFKAHALYPLILNTLLAIGIYASVRGIDFHDLTGEQGKLVSVVTLGVGLKIIIIGGLLYALTNNLNVFIFAIIIAQIDPLSVSALTLEGSYQISPKARSFLLAWASFDDPITVIAAVAATQFVLHVDLTLLSTEWYWEFGNIALPLITYIVHKNFCSEPNLVHKERFLLLASSIVAIVFGWMLSIAVIGIFLRPSLFNKEKHIILGAYIVSVVLLGSYLQHGVDIILGMKLAGAAIAAQAIASLIFMRRSPRLDRAYLACAQQNGITAVILSLLFARHIEQVTAVVTAAIVVINLMHTVLFFLLDEYVLHKYEYARQKSGAQPARKPKTASSPISAE
jgi:hypothetical protein